MSYLGKNYNEPGGDVLHVGGKIVFDDDAEMSNFPAAANVQADTGTASKNAAVINAMLIAMKNAGLMIADDWSVTIPTGITYSNMATEGTATNSNKATVTIEDDVINIAIGGAVEDSLEKVDHGDEFGEHYWLGFGIRTGLASDAGVKFTQLTGMEDGKPPVTVTLTADDDTEAHTVGLAEGGDIILYVKAEVVRDNGGMTFAVGYDGLKTLQYTVVIDERES